MAKKRIPKKVKKLVQNYVQRLVERDKLPVKKVMIFGSRTKGRTHKWSDIDICIVSPKFRNNLKALEYLWSKRIDKEVMSGLEPVGFSPEDFREGGSFINEIKRTGIIVR